MRIVGEASKLDALDTISGESISLYSSVIPSSVRTLEYVGQPPIGKLPAPASVKVLKRDLHCAMPGLMRSVRARLSSKACSTESSFAPGCSAIHFVPVSSEAKKKTRWQKLSITS